MSVPAQAFAPAPQAEAYATAIGVTNGTSRQASAFPAPRFADGQTLRFAVPDEGTLQFLPGRLEVVVGPESGREIRFVRSPNTPETDITFGRSEGPPHRHVQLLAPTVSRRHALMSLIDEHWSLQNLSATNPVTHNGRRLAPDEVVPLLVDGDRLEMGEVVFVFHNR
ncbi:MAG TPA: FHA domain-containing protein [Gemmatirosa sp.]